MHHGESMLGPAVEQLMSTVHRRQFDMAVREAELKRRETALRRIERDMALTPVPAEYFHPGKNSDEGGWWAKQLGNTQPALG